MDEFNQENQNTNEAEVNPAQENSDEANTAYDEKIETPIDTTASEQTFIAEELKNKEISSEPRQENNFFAEESYYDTHSLPPQAPPPQYRPPYQQQQPPYQPYPQQPQYRPTYPPQQPPYPQQQYGMPYPQQQNPYQQQYRPQPQQNPNQQQVYKNPYEPETYIPPQPRPQTPPPNGPQPNYYAQPQPQGPEKKKKKKGAVIAFIVAGILLAGIVTTFVILINSNTNKNNRDFGSMSEAQSKSGSESTYEIPTQTKPDVDEEYKGDDGKYTTQGVAKVVSPSVVGIVIYSEGQTLTPTSQGSGIIISADGYIATNAHVVEGASSQKVILSDGTECLAAIVGRDSKSDLAVLKIEPKTDIVAAELGNSDQLELGEQVITLGNPGGLANSFSGGFVSGLNRQIKASDTGLAMNCIQTDAAVNPGNSGGPLVNMYGQVVGIVSSKYVATGYEGIGFAISINDALPIIQDIIGQGYVSDRIKIGIVFQALNEATATEYEVVPGLYINQIDPACDVANSGLQVNDIITEINGQKVYDYSTVMTAIDGQKPGDTVTAKVYRKSIVNEVKEFEISFKLMEDTSAD